MVIATNFEPPTEGIRHREVNTQALIRSKDLGKGTLLISESRLCWSGEGGTGFSLEYPAIQLHAVSRDPSLAPRPCLYIVVEGDLLGASSQNENAALPREPAQNGSSSRVLVSGPSNGNGTSILREESSGEDGDDRASDSSIGSDGDSTTEIRFIPPADESLPAMYAAMCECQALHPDPCVQGDEESGDDGEEYDVEQAEQHQGIHPRGDGENNEPDEYMDGQFDDAD